MLELRTYSLYVIYVLLIFYCTINILENMNIFYNHYFTLQCQIWPVRHTEKSELNHMSRSCENTVNNWYGFISLITMGKDYVAQKCWKQCLCLSVTRISLPHLKWSPTSFQVFSVSEISYVVWWLPELLRAPWWSDVHQWRSCREEQELHVVRSVPSCHTAGQV